MPSLNHTHTYERMRNKSYYRCVDPHCSHTQKRELLEKKACICYKCNNEFILTWEDLRRARPICLNCSNTEEARRLREVRENVGNVIEEMFKE